MVLIAAVAAGCERERPHGPDDARRRYDPVATDLKRAVDAAVGPLTWHAAGHPEPVRLNGRCMINIGDRVGALDAAPSDPKALLKGLDKTLTSHNFAAASKFTTASDGTLSLTSKDNHGARVELSFSDSRAVVSVDVPARPGACHEHEGES